MRIIYLLIFCFIGFSEAFAQQNAKIYGKIIDENYHPIPFSSVLIFGTTEGVSANNQGQYQINVSNQKPIVLRFSAMGYQSVIKSFDANLAQKDRLFDVVLKSQVYTLNEVQVGKYKDPAYAIIKKAIQLRKQHLNEIEELSYDIYTKSVQQLIKSPKKFMGVDIQKELDLDSNQSAILYQSEAISKFNFKKPNLVKEVVFSSKVAGNNQALTFNSGNQLRINFYENIVLKEIPGVSTGLVSPIAENALSFYKYQLLGSTKSENNEIFKIKFEAKNLKSPTFSSGLIYISDKTFYISDINAKVSKSAGMQLLNEFEIKQQYAPVGHLFLPLITQSKFTGGLLSFKFGGNDLGVYSNYNLTPNFSPKFFNGEILRIDSSAVKLDSSYWRIIRPVPLSAEEVKTYRFKDSIYKVKTSPEYLDSVDKKRNQFKGSHILFGYSYFNRVKNARFGIESLLKAIQYNTVEGVVLNANTFYKKELSYHKSIKLNTHIRYGFGNQMLNGNMSLSYLTNPIKVSYLAIKVGSDVLDMNDKAPFEAIYNGINTLFFGKNWSKLYRSKFLNLDYSTRLISSLKGAFLLSFSENYSLQNTTFNNFRNFPPSVFTSNNPLDLRQNTPAFDIYRNFKIAAKFSYSFENQYKTRGDVRVYEQSRYPIVSLMYEKAIPQIAGSVADYDQLIVSIQKNNLHFGLWGTGNILLSGGGFLSNKNVYYPDRIHFSGTQSIVSKERSNAFSFLNLYRYSTDKSFLEGHYQHNFQGRWSNKVPLFRKLHLTEVLEVNTLYQNDVKYNEINFGFKHFSGFKATYGFAFQGNDKLIQGIRLFMIF